jgi:hypothetical protein
MYGVLVGCSDLRDADAGVLRPSAVDKVYLTGRRGSPHHLRDCLGSRTQRFAAAFEYQRKYV